MISASVSGSFNNTLLFLKRMQKLPIMDILNAQGQIGVNTLAAATPKDSARAAGAWSFKAEAKGKGCTLTWLNSDLENGFPVAIMLQYGYSTGTGGFVKGRDYINPAMRPIFDQIANAVWKAVTSA